MTNTVTETQVATTFKRRKTIALKRHQTHIEKLQKPSRVAEMHATEFAIDPRVQRTLNEVRVQLMAEDFRPDSLGIITVSRRLDGRYYTLDGNHRVSAARLANYTGLMAVRIFENLTLAEEAGLFLTLNNTKSVQPIDKFKVRITLGDRIAVNINKILGMHGLHVDWSASTQPNSISAITALEKVYRGAGVRPEGEYAELVDKVIKTIKYTQDVNVKQVVYSRTFIDGLGIFFATFGNRIDDDRLKQVLGNITPTQLATRARTKRDALGGTIGENSAEVIWDMYNNRLRHGKLPEFKKVHPMDFYVPEDDKLYVDPNQFVQEPEKANA